MDVSCATFGKPTKGETQDYLMKCFVRVGSFQRDLPYIDFCNEDKDSYRNTVLDLDCE